jgi:hypothetical protein
MSVALVADGRRVGAGRGGARRRDPSYGLPHAGVARGTSSLAASYWGSCATGGASPRRRGGVALRMRPASRLVCGGGCRSWCTGEPPRVKGGQRSRYLPLAVCAGGVVVFPQLQRRWGCRELLGRGERRRVSSTSLAMYFRTRGGSGHGGRCAARESRFRCFSPSTTSGCDPRDGGCRGVRRTCEEQSARAERLRPIGYKRHPGVLSRQHHTGSGQSQGDLPRVTSRNCLSLASEVSALSVLTRPSDTCARAG